MKRIITSLLIVSILLSLLCGCQNNSQDSTGTTEAETTFETSSNGSTETTDDRTKPFEEYAISITADFLYIYKEPNYEAEIIGILEKGAYIVTDQTSNSYGGVPLRWGEIKGYDGWIILNYINDDGYSGEVEFPTESNPNYNPETSVDTQTPDTSNTPFNSYKIKVLNNCLSVYSQPKISSNYWLYDITDNRTITIVEEREVLFYANYHSWARLESGGWVRLDSITDTRYNNTEDTSTPPDTSIPDISVPDNTPSDNSDNNETTSKPTENDNTEINGEYITKNVYGCGSKRTQTIKGVTFVWYDEYYISTKKTTIKFNTFKMRYEKDGEYSHNLECDYDITISNDKSVLIYYQSFDKDGYFIDEHMITIFDQNDRLVSSGLQKKAKGYGDFFEYADIMNNSKTVIIYPL
ncbi:MAG: hypothetical protein E7541_01130 [Ruminococcaceae bacterium]|nr:hypothetical protein [Oscillospiraceae bacterium]